MSDSINPRAQRFAALMLLGVCVLMLLSLTIAPLIGIARSEVEQRQLLRKELAKLQGLVDAMPQMSSLLAQIDAHPMWQRVYHDASVADSESELQKDFRALAEAQGISVDTLQPLDASREGNFDHISLRVGFSTTIDHLGQLLLAMQTAPHFMKFENIYVTSPMTQTPTGNAALVVRGDVQAFLIPEKKP